MGYTYTANGDGTSWETSANWSSPDGGTHYPGYEAGDTAVIPTGDAMYVNAVAPAYHLVDLIVIGSLILYNDLTVDGACIITGTCTDHGSPYLHAQGLFGEPALLGNTYSGVDRYVACQFTAPATGTLGNVWAYLNGSGGWKPILYSDSGNAPAARLAVGNGTELLSLGGWYKQALSYPVTVGSKYWLGFQIQSSSRLYYYANVSGGLSARQTLSYGSSAPDPWPTPIESSNTYHYMVYAEYAKPPGVILTQFLPILKAR